MHLMALGQLVFGRIPHEQPPTVHCRPSLLRSVTVVCVRRKGVCTCSSDGTRPRAHTGTGAASSERRRGRDAGSERGQCRGPGLRGRRHRHQRCQAQRWRSLCQLRTVRRQRGRPRRALPALWRKAGGREGLVYRIREKGLTRAGPARDTSPAPQDRAGAAVARNKPVSSRVLASSCRRRSICFVTSTKLATTPVGAGPPSSNKGIAGMLIHRRPRPGAMMPMIAPRCGTPVRTAPMPGALRPARGCGRPRAACAPAVCRASCRGSVPRRQWRRSPARRPTARPRLRPAGR